MKISIAIMAHPDRQLAAIKLQRKLVQMPFEDCHIIYDDSNNEWDTGKRALKWGIGKGDWHIVIQDDAIISESFYKNVVRSLIAGLVLVDDKLKIISYYTGTVRPFPSAINRAVEKAKQDDSSWIVGKGLYWGVCVIIKTDVIKDMSDHADKFKLPYDERISHYFLSQRIPVYYSYPSIVDHDWEMNSLLGHDIDIEPRVAHRYESEAISWNGKAVEI